MLRARDISSDDTLFFILGIAENGKITTAKATSRSYIVHGKCSVFTPLPPFTWRGTEVAYQQFLFPYVCSDISAEQLPRCELKAAYKITKKCNLPTMHPVSIYHWGYKIIFIAIFDYKTYVLNEE